MTIEYKEIDNLDPPFWECVTCTSAGRSGGYSDGTLEKVLEDAGTHNVVFGFHSITVYLRTGTKPSDASENITTDQPMN